jgi:hypothetical protein
VLPFTREQFFEIFAAYNAANWIAAIGVYPIALLALFMAWRGESHAGRWVGAILAFMWGWVGVIYQGVYFSQINPAAKGFAGAFGFQAVLFAIHAALGRGLEFGPRSQVRTFVGAMLITYAMLVYPLLGLLVGERYPAMPLFGVAPCPLLIFTFGLLVWASCVRWWLWVVPLLWSIVGGSASLLLSVPQDWALPIAAVAVLLITLLDRSPIKA